MPNVNHLLSSGNYQAHQKNKHPVIHAHDQLPPAEKASLLGKPGAALPGSQSQFSDTQLINTAASAAEPDAYLPPFRRPVVQAPINPSEADKDDSDASEEELDLPAGLCEVNSRKFKQPFFEPVPEHLKLFFPLHRRGTDRPFPPLSPSNRILIDQSSAAWPSGLHAAIALPLTKLVWEKDAVLTDAK